jgi:Ran GTPase-activating protein 1
MSTTIRDSICSFPHGRVKGLTDNMLGAEGAFTLAEELGKDKTIVALYISKNGVGPGRGSTALARLVGHADSTVRRLGLNFNHLGDAGALPFASNLGTNLQVLGLSGNRLTDATAVALASALRSGRNTGLLRLFLAENFITCVGAKALASMLASNVTLKRLGLSGCCIGKEGGTAICDAVETAMARKEPRQVLLTGGGGDFRVQGAGVSGGGCIVSLK